MNKTVIECNGIAAGYVKGLNILQGVDLIVHEKEIVSIIGPNGAGKSTLLKAIMGIINISGGRFFINGLEKTNTPTHQIVSEGVGYVPQVENVFPSLTIEENLEIGSWSVKDNMKQSISKIFGDFPMLKERQKDKAGNLSGGQRQILALARALVTSPNILLLDEPSAGLSPVAIKEVFEIVKEINSRGVAILLVEQNATRALNFSDRGYVLDQGRNAYQGKGQELLNDPRVVDLYLGKL
ncbi:ABC transporter ATP-binding protein [Acidimicrobiaceae bacterium]|jgi:branched-chain amino acid transport system ATP-binding protein|uniref:ABC-type branched-chain amino acid transport systems, ATPase component n=1 Tax=Candidatus Actinomarina minuta TaxID=1389454 RepID=S5DRF6_9ACTN|nr:ABC-type branched-chain amino acid transport systems, ATPase component [Candidatus Actinomarina minuta]MDC3103644.1 ABC transporter ATP-binding protein [Acidimicrobiaceae bacterium]|tara:strand:- start:68 stop:784 length:717 start_codon:yes stop_codon:yes gene_type:complete